MHRPMKAYNFQSHDAYLDVYKFRYVELLTKYYFVCLIMIRNSVQSHYHDTNVTHTRTILVIPSD